MNPAGLAVMTVRWNTCVRALEASAAQKIIARPDHTASIKG